MRWARSSSQGRGVPARSVTPTAPRHRASAGTFPMSQVMTLRPSTAEPVPFS